MKRIITIAVMCLSCAGVFAQWEDVEAWNELEPVDIEIGKNILLDNELYKGQWLEDQACAWQKVVNVNPKNEKAWKNLFWASYLFEIRNKWFSMSEYYINYLKPDVFINEADSKTAKVVRRMKEAIPDTYTVNLCSYIWDSNVNDVFDKKTLHDAIKLAPRDVNAEEIRHLSYGLWQEDPNNEMLYNSNRILYEKNVYPEHVMIYGWNILNSMSEGAVYIAYRAFEYEQMKLIQEVFEERKDITLIPYNFFRNKNYRDYVCERLKIKPFVCNKNMEYNALCTDFIRHIKRNCKNDVYMSMSMPFKSKRGYSSKDKTYLGLSPDSIYNEGLIVKYSDKQYDNLKVAIHNVREVYKLEYLTLPMLTFEAKTINEYVDENVIYSMSKLVDQLLDLGYETECWRLQKIMDKVYYFEGNERIYTKRKRRNLY